MLLLSVYHCVKVISKFGTVKKVIKKYLLKWKIYVDTNNQGKFKTAVRKKNTMFVVLTHRFWHHKQPFKHHKTSEILSFNMNMCCTLIFCFTTGGNHINGQSATWPHGWSDRTAQVHRRRAGRDFRQEVHNLISSLLHHSSSHNYPEW